MDKNKTEEENSSSNSKSKEENKNDWEKKAQEYLNGWKRAKADYLNLKKEKDKEREEIMKFSNAALIIQLLPIYDHLKMAFDHIPEDLKDNEWVKGIEGIKKQTQDFIESIGIKEIKTVGEKFNPEKHEAVAHEKNKDFESDIIFEETKPGYKLHDKVLYPAKVKVAK